MAGTCEGLFTKEWPPKDYWHSASGQRLIIKHTFLDLEEQNDDPADIDMETGLHQRQARALSETALDDMIDRHDSFIKYSVCEYPKSYHSYSTKDSDGADVNIDNNSLADDETEREEVRQDTMETIEYVVDEVEHQRTSITEGEQDKVEQNSACQSMAAPMAPTGSPNIIQHTYAFANCSREMRPLYQYGYGIQHAMQPSVDIYSNPQLTTVWSPEACLNAAHSSAWRYTGAFQQTTAAVSSEGIPGPVTSIPASEEQPFHKKKSSTSVTREKMLSTVMLKNLPNNMKRDTFADLLNSFGFAGLYDFLYIPYDFHRCNGLGYAFVNFIGTKHAESAKVCFQNFTEWREWGFTSTKRCQVCWSGPLQGLEAHVERYRNSPLMHPDVPEMCKPLLYVNGIRTPFPPPTRQLRPPRKTVCATLRHESASFASNRAAVDHSKHTTIPSPVVFIASAEEQPFQKETNCSTDATKEESLSTLMFKSLPNNMKRDTFVDLLDSHGFAGLYDFLYMPWDFHCRNGLGYAFVNFVVQEYAEFAKAYFQDFTEWGIESSKRCEVCWSDPLQGLEAHVERYRNSPAMHPDVLEMCKPLLFVNGVRTQFPPPTRQIRPPHAKHGIPFLHGCASSAPSNGRGDHEQEIAAAASSQSTSSRTTSIPAAEEQPFQKDANSSIDSTEEELLSSVMFKNLPNNMKRDTFVDLLDSRGFRGLYDFLYMPVDFQHHNSRGYAFVNFVVAEHAESAKDYFQDFTEWGFESSKRCEVCWSDPLQGLEANVERYRNSPVMHPDVPEIFKPLLFVNGVRTQFPPPTRQLRSLHAKHGIPSLHGCASSAPSTGRGDHEQEIAAAASSHSIPILTTSIPAAEEQPFQKTTKCSTNITEEEMLSTVMFQNLPNSMKRDTFADLLDSHGFAGLYDFLYVPWDFNCRNGLGYAFVNFVVQKYAESAKAYFQDFTEWGLESSERCEVCWSDPLQGLKVHVESYRNSSVMHPDVPEMCKPLLYVNGVRAQFPAPTRQLRPPHAKHGIPFLHGCASSALSNRGEDHEQHLAVAASSQGIPSPVTSIPEAEEQPFKKKTKLSTVMFKNLPNNMLRDTFADFLDSQGFAGLYNFLYVPWDFHRLNGFGYAFVNFVVQEYAVSAKAYFQNFTEWAEWGFKSSKRCEVCWSEPLQGLESHVERYRNSPVMHADVPEMYRPLLFVNGVRTPFPPATKLLKSPRKTVRVPCLPGCTSPVTSSAGEDHAKQVTPAASSQDIPGEEAVIPLAEKQPFTKEKLLSTVMFKSLPNNMRRDTFVDLLNRHGFAGLYDFLYLPVDFHCQAGLGYAFVNFVVAEHAESAKDYFQDFTDWGEWGFESSKKCAVCWSAPYQGLEAHVERYRNSPVMHKDVPEMFKPLLFINGVRTRFPPPTRQLKAPRRKVCASGQH